VALAACGSDATGVEDDFAASGGLLTDATGPAPTNATSASNCNGVRGAVSVGKMSVPMCGGGPDEAAVAFYVSVTHR